MEKAKYISLTVQSFVHESPILTKHEGSANVSISSVTTVSDVLKFVSDCEKLTALIFRNVPESSDYDECFVNLLVSECDGTGKPLTDIHRYGFAGSMKSKGQIVLKSDDDEHDYITIYEGESFMTAVSKHITL